jgi:hypothetical protein
MSQDFMVNWGTSVMDASVQCFTGNDLLDSIRARGAAANCQRIDRDFDPKGCKVAFSFSYPQREPSAEMEAEQDREVEEALPVKKKSDIKTVEEVMAERLQSLGWKVVSIEYVNQIPLSNHNRIVAMSRTPVHTWINATGKRGALHLIDTIVAAFNTDHNPIFDPVVTEEAQASTSILSLFF